MHDGFHSFPLVVLGLDIEGLPFDCVYSDWVQDRWLQYPFPAYTGPQVESLFDSPEQFMAEYEAWSTQSTVSEREKQKKLDLYIGLSLIGPRGREQMVTRLRMKRDTYNPS